MARNIRLGIAFVLCGFVIAGCIAGPRLTNRYRSKDFKQTKRFDHYATAGVSVGAIESVPSTQPSALALHLSPEGQAAAAVMVGLRSTKAADIIDALRSPLKKDAGGIPDEIENTRFEKRLFFAVGKTPDARPGDRIDSVRLELSLDRDDPAKISSISRYETRYEVAELGKIASKQASSQTGSAEVGPFNVGPATMPVKLSGSLTSSQEISEELVLRQRYEAFTAQLAGDGKQLKVFQEGVVGIDATGVFTIDVKLSTPRMNGFHILRTEPLFKDRAPLEPGKFDFKFVQVYSPSQPVRACLSGSYRIRRIVSGDRTVVEGDDRVQFIDGSFACQEITLVPTEEIFERTATIGIEARRGDKYLPLHVAWKPTETDSFPLDFFGVPEARKFIDWIQAKSTNTKLNDNYVLFVFEDNKLTPLGTDDIDTLRVGAGTLPESHVAP